jgi:signal transduction histidine kinase
VHVDVVVCLVRIAQESMRNAVIHGDATRLTISLERTDEQIELSITDNGGGFDVEAVRGTNTGLGLVSMEERARGVGAHVQIVSGVHQGTTVFVRGPVQSGASTHEL